MQRQHEHLEPPPAAPLDPHTKRVANPAAQFRQAAFTFDSENDPIRPPEPILKFFAPTYVVDPVAARISDAVTPSPMHHPDAIKHWETLLTGYPVGERAGWLIHHLKFRFLLGMNEARLAAAGDVRGPRVNNKSAEQFPEAVSAKLDEGVALGQLYASTTCPEFLEKPFFSPLGIEVKPSKTPGGPDSYRLVSDMTRALVNNFVDEETKHIAYINLQEICRRLMRLAPGSAVFLLDVAAAYRHLALHPSQYSRSMYYWKGVYYVDTRLCFGCSSGPILFDQMATCLQWILQKLTKTPMMRLLDDTAGMPPSVAKGDEDIAVCIETGDKLGVEFKYEKIKRPCRNPLFLGWLFDLDRQCVSIPQHRWERAMREIKLITGEAYTPMTQFESTTGLLGFLSAVVPDARLYMRHAYTFIAAIALSTSRSLWGRVQIPMHVRNDMLWWRNLVYDSTSATAPFLAFGVPPPRQPANRVAYTDASGRALGVFVLPHAYCSAAFPPTAFQEPFDINYFELAAVYASVSVFGHLWQGMHIWSYCDNEDVLYAWEKQSASSTRMHLLLCDLHTLVTSLNFSLSIAWINTKSNQAADYLSRQRDHTKIVHAAPFAHLTQRWQVPEAMLARV